MLETAGGPQVDVLLRNNRLGGGQFALYAGASSGSRDIRIIGNRLGKAAPDISPAETTPFPVRSGATTR